MVRSSFLMFPKFERVSRNAHGNPDLHEIVALATWMSVVELTLLKILSKITHHVE